MRKTVILLLFLVISSISCEKDDICGSADATTPRLIIDLYNAESPENKKNANDLIVSGIDNDFALSGYFVNDVNQLVLPLRTDTNITQYELMLDATLNDNDTPDDATDDYYEGNIDTITVNYVPVEVYVSRACGYKTIYTEVTLTIEDDDDNWLLSRQPLTDNQSVENEDETHFNITH
ncbi:hypothetical protein PK35_08895 [Tamlana nanhaiensis]|uniref:Uncharacterized protein n=1 Tax=Neotamlana nanhaiensis TaxID=1382798 RepID=A0A0D7W1V5_9FLAO|nr:DUF6452 family protein [Tamlana nanhaiensis]KJD33071.1 hypothetical protein PK35_08895 [Tamlana nanhaiensis]